MEVSGKVINLAEIQTGTSAKGDWTKQDFVIETEGDYPKKICINSFNNKVDLSAWKIGDVVTVSVNIESREYNGKWYTNVSAWKIDLVEAGGNSELPPSEQINNSEPPF